MTSSETGPVRRNSSRPSISFKNIRTKHISSTGHLADKIALKLEAIILPWGVDRQVELQA